MNRPWVRSATVAIMALCVLGIGLVGALRWTLIPLAVNGRVEMSGYQDGTGEHFRTLDLEDGRSVVVDRSLVERAGGRNVLEGAEVRKESWQATLAVDDHRIVLRMSSEFWRTIASLAFLVAVGMLRRVMLHRPAPPILSDPC